MKSKGSIQLTVMKCFSKVAHKKDVFTSFAVLSMQVRLKVAFLNKWEWNTHTHTQNKRYFRKE